MENDVKNKYKLIKIELTQIKINQHPRKFLIFIYFFFLSTHNTLTPIELYELGAIVTVQMGLTRKIKN